MCSGHTRNVALIAVVLALASTGIVRSSGSLLVTFVSRGPAAIRLPGNTSGLTPLAGAVRAIVVDPGDRNTIYIGSVNGGIWKTTDGLSATPTWTPLTDDAPSLSIGAMELDPTFSSRTVIVAALGRASSLIDVFGARAGGKLAGILRTTDGVHFVNLGARALAGENLDAVVPRGRFIVVASKSRGGGGVFLSTDTGLTFTSLSKGPAAPLPSGKAFDLAGDPANPNRLFAAIGGTNGDVFVNDATGAGAWAPLRLSDPKLGAQLASADNIKLATGFEAITNTLVLYAVVQTPDGIVRVFRHARGAWTALESPSTVECHALQGLKKRGGSQPEDLSIVVHPVDVDLVFLGGAAQPTVPGPDGDCSTDDAPGSGRLFRCDASKPMGSQCAPIVAEFTTQYTGPHPDSRILRFDGTDLLLDGDDGGIYRRTLPQTTLGDWSSMNGHLAISETTSCAHDSVTGLLFCGLQDNGTARQPSPDDTVWNRVAGGDGGNVAVGYNDPASPTMSVRYHSAQFLAGFRRELCSAANCLTIAPHAIVVGTGLSIQKFDTKLPNSTPIAANAVDMSRVVIAGSAVYESIDQGDTFKRLTGQGLGAPTGIAYGGIEDKKPQKDVLYVATKTGLFLRKPSEPDLKRTRYPDVPVDIAIDPADWKSAWVVSSSTVRHTDNAGATWDDITGDIADAGAAEFRSIEFIPGSLASIIAVGASDGVYVANTAHPQRWSKITGTLPNAVAYDLSYDRPEDLLVVSTLGRGVWTLGDASRMNLPPYVGAVSVTPSPVLVGTSVDASAQFTDRGATGTPSGTVRWDDRSSGTAATIAGSSTSGTVSARHTYDAAGLYTVTVRVIDKDGGEGTSSSGPVVVVDPKAGSLTGSGSITSPAGAYRPDRSLKGRATFDITAKYKTAQIPVVEGNVRVRFAAAGFEFNSTALDWLVVSGRRAQLKGTGRTNDGRPCAFMVTAEDGRLGGGFGADTVRFKVWEPLTGAVRYDTQTGAPDTAGPTTKVTTGSVSILR